LAINKHYILETISDPAIEIGPGDILRNSAMVDELVKGHE
jgi:hypothetical protein